MNGFGKVVMESVIETKASTILQFIHGLHGDLYVTFEEGRRSAWLYDLLKPHVSGLWCAIRGGMPCCERPSRKASYGVKS
jgi:hypothetical protein